MRRFLKNILVLMGMFLLVIYYFRRQVIGRLLRLSPQIYKVTVDWNLRVPASDGITLAADHYAPQAHNSERFPTILIRSPYGRNRNAGAFGLLLSFIAYRFAERGYHVVLQDTRGRFDSQGVFVPYFNEKRDGQATLDWLAKQDWFNGVVGLWGSSYLGIVQWVIADQPPVKALVPSITSSRLYTILYPDGVLDLGLALRWLTIFQALDENPSLLAAPRLLPRVEKAIKPAFSHLPAVEADSIALGKPVDYYHLWLEHSALDDEYWQEADSLPVERITAPVHLIGGWYDFFLRGMLDDYHALQAAGHRPYLTIGPWHHFSMIASLADVREGLIWFDAHLKGDRSRLRAKPVRIYVMGANEWREMASWPPEAHSTCYYLHSEQRLSTASSRADIATSSYRYDPADPTPALGGTQFSPYAGPRVNNRLETRPDVLTYTTLPLERAVEVIGQVKLELYVKSSLEHTDFFGRICDVYPDGRSINICDGLFRVEPGRGEPQPDGSLHITIDLWATAHRFQPGHAVRLQVSSGAHPRWSRNLGTGEPLGSGTAMRIAEQTIFHDQSHPSALVLPVTN